MTNVATPPMQTDTHNQVPIAPPIRYCLYARKSSEDDERQALSIESQIQEMKEKAKKDGIEVLDILKESKSAKASGVRTTFNTLLTGIREGEYNGILTWAPDRLSRNAGDLGSLVDLMDQGLLQEIRTNGQTFTNNPNEKFMLMILCSQAKLENDNRGMNVKRGMKTRAKMGYRPCMPPLGYLTHRPVGATRSTAVIDPDRGPIITKVFEQIAYEGMSGREAYFWMNEQGFTTRKGKKVTLSMFYRLLRNTFYYGDYEYPKGSKQWYTGDHEPLISKQLFTKVGKSLDEAPKKEWGKKEFAFTRMLTCGQCGSMISAEEKFKYRKDGSSKRYVYYHCNRSKDRSCTDPYIREDVLIEQVAEILDSLTIKTKEVREKLEVDYERHCTFITNVLGNDAEFTMPKINRKQYVRYVLNEAPMEKKREILACLKSELVLRDGKVDIQD